MTAEGSGACSEPDCVDGYTHEEPARPQLPLGLVPDEKDET